VTTLRFLDSTIEYPLARTPFCARYRVILPAMTADTLSVASQAITQFPTIYFRHPGTENYTEISSLLSTYDPNGGKFPFDVSLDCLSFSQAMMFDH
jgi:hypothetical protein